MKLSIALIQMMGSMDKTASIEKARKMILEAAKNGARLIVLPEMWNCPYSSDYFKDYAEPEDGQTYSFMASIAKAANIYLVGGSIPERDQGRVF
ncbi:MAG: nitrilase-related carbon-nitrogen hydrolase, partial [Anaerovoracaceae bacterium]|nr:nitrilase-related carbon-nitrogen hydrolase [Anaerovoracaceae bacterium]